MKMKRLSRLLRMRVVLSAGCTESPPPGLAPEWRWEVPHPSGVRDLVRLSDGGVLLSLDGDYWGVVRLSAAGEVVWEIEFPFVPDAHAPSVAVTADGEALAAHATGQRSCQVSRVDDGGQPGATFDYAGEGALMIGGEDGGFAIGTVLSDS